MRGDNTPRIFWFRGKQGLMMNVFRNGFAIILVVFSSFTFAQDFRDATFVKPLDEQIRLYQQLLRENPKKVEDSNRLAFAYIQKVRATQDQSYNLMAEKLLQSALATDSRNYDSLVYLSLVQLSQHRFADAKKTAARAIELRQSDSTAYGMLGDAAYELGLYSESSRAYQKMMDLRPSASSYSRAAFYRRIVGDLSGAAMLMKQALQLADVRDTENQAWCLFQLGNFAFQEGKLYESEKYYSYSLKLFPNYYNSLAGLAKVKAAQGETGAIELYEKAIAIVPMPEFVAALGDLYLISGEKQKARQEFDLVEYIGLISRINREIFNRQLALFYADHDRNLPEAVRLTSDELSVRKDVFGYDAAAWCLFKDGKWRQAMPLMRQALSMGTRDPLLFFHAGMIFETAGMRAQARKYFRNAISLNPEFHPIFAETAKKELAALKKG